MLTKQGKFLVAVSLQVAIIFAIIIFKLAVLAGGTDILLQIEPVDPRDLLRGDYATFQYNISNPNSYLADETVRSGDTVYVTLRYAGKYWVASRVSKSKPTSGVFLKGKVESGGAQSAEGQFRIPGFNTDLARFHVVYGIEEYFIPEGTGRNFNFWGRDAGALVKVDDGGRAVLKQIYIDDRPWP